MIFQPKKFDPSHKMDPAKSIATAPQFPHLKILLAHQPNSAFEVVKLKYFDLQISGHTHGGQIWPMTWLIHFIQPFHPGLTFLKICLFMLVEELDIGASCKIRL